MEGTRTDYIASNDDSYCLLGSYVEGNSSDLSQGAQENCIKPLSG